jgi:hypothetical protein
MASRTLFALQRATRLRSLRVGAFVHVREDKVPDRGKLKVYQLTKFWPETEEFEGPYWEQPRFDGSSLREHDFDDGDHPIVKLLPEIVHTPEIHLMDIRITDPLPAFNIHWETVVKMDVTPVRIKGAYRKIMKSVRGKLVLEAGRFGVQTSLLGEDSGGGETWDHSAVRAPSTCRRPTACLARRHHSSCSPTSHP